MSKKHTCTEEQFLRDVKDHGIEIINDNDIHRHVIFRTPGSSIYWFELITWPDALCINGDCGSYVFSRVKDMFRFFRESDGSKGLTINPRYWGEKLQAADTSSGFMEFDKNSFIERVKEHFDNFVESHPELDEKNELWETIEDEVLFYSDNEHEAYSAVNNFDHFIGNDVFEFSDFFDDGGTETYTARYLWCLYAIVWGISQYDLSKKTVAV